MFTVVFWKFCRFLANVNMNSRSLSHLLMMSFLSLFRFPFLTSFVESVIGLGLTLNVAIDHFRLPIRPCNLLAYI